MASARPIASFCGATWRRSSRLTKIEFTIGHELKHYVMGDNWKALAIIAASCWRGADDDAASTLSMEDHLTNPGTTVGTVAICRRNKFARVNWTHAPICSDSVWCYEMATGKLPFHGESSGVIFHAILERPPVPPARLNPDVPAKLEEIIDKCLEKDRNLRYQHASDIRADLQRFKRDSDSGRAPAQRPSSS